MLKKILQELSRRQSPSLLWYAPDGERIELSGKVVDNWVSKSANLLEEELQVGPEDTVVFASQLHWKTLIISLAVLECGATARFIDVSHPGADQVDQTELEHIVSSELELRTAKLLVTDRSSLVTRLSSDVEILAVALGALAPAFPGELPAHAIDYAASVRMFADSFDAFGQPQGSDIAVADLRRSYTFEELSVAAGAAMVELMGEPNGGERFYHGDESALVLSSDTPTALVVVASLGLWKQAKTVVLVEPSLYADPAKLSAIVAQENGFLV